jgi:hypothetical protein
MPDRVVVDGSNVTDERVRKRTLVCPTWACTRYLKGGNRKQ